jgi:hypothetical protein
MAAITARELELQMPDASKLLSDDFMMAQL